MRSENNKTHKHLYRNELKLFYTPFLSWINCDTSVFKPCDFSRSSQLSIFTEKSNSPGQPFFTNKLTGYQHCQEAKFIPFRDIFFHIRAATVMERAIINRCRLPCCHPGLGPPAQRFLLPFTFRLNN